MARDTITINKSLVPYSFNIVLGKEEFNFRVDYNNTGDFFTIELKKNGVTLCSGEPIIYGRKLFKDVRTPEFPIVDIIPFDLTKEYNTVTYKNLCEGVSLVLDNRETSIIENDY